MKRILVILVILVLMINVAYASDSVTMKMQVDNDEYIVVNNDDILTKAFDATPIMIEDVTFVPVRGIFEHFGATVDWISESEKIEITMNSSVIVLKNGSNEAFVNDQAHQLNQSVTVVNKRTMIPLRFISEALGFNVKWEETEKSIIISNKDLIDTEEDLSTYVENVTVRQLAKSINPQLDYIRNTIAKIWISDTFERDDFWKLSSRASQIANTMEQAEMLYQNLYPQLCETHEIKDSWKYFEFVRIDFSQMSNGYGELIDQEIEFLKSVHNTISEITNYREEVLESDDQNYSSLEKLAMLMNMVPKDQAKIRLNMVKSKPLERLEEPLTREEAMTKIDSKYEVKGYSFEQMFFHAFLVEVEGEEYVVAIHKDYGHISGVLALNASRYYKQVEFEAIE